MKIGLMPAVLTVSSLWLGCGETKEPGAGGDAGSATGGSSVAGKGGASQGGGGASGAGASGAGGGGLGGGGAGDPGVPLLDRPAELTYDCEVTRPMSLLGLNPWVGGGLHASEELAHLLRLEGTMPGSGTGLKVGWSTLDADGVLGTPGALPTPNQTYLSQLATTQVDDIFTLAWVESGGNDAQLAIASVNAAGDVLLPRTPLTSGAGDRSRPAIGGLADGFGVAWTRQGNQRGTIEFLRVDAQGAPVGDVELVVEGSGNLQAHDLIAHGDGFVLVYSRFDYPANIQGIFYALLDADGVRQGEPVELGAGLGPTSVLRRGKNLLVAWAVQDGGYEMSDIARTIGIGTIGPSGERVGPTYALQAPLVHQENVDPHWLDLGDDVGLFWTQGEVIYVCAGCFPDNQLKFAVFSGNDLTRKSEVLTLPSSTQFGLRAPKAVRVQDDILAVASVTHHVDAEGASATIRCTP